MNSINELRKKLKEKLLNRDEYWHKRMFWWVVTVVIGLGMAGLILVAGTIAILSFGLPDVTDLESITAAQSTEIFDKDGELLYTIHGDENREAVDYEDISQYVKDATVAIEDNAFWTHGGFDVGALFKVALYEIFNVGVPRGGSTITQQYVKNTFLSSERTYIRKAKELILAIRVERAYTKEEILGLYLNRIPYGNNAYGVEKASEIYFGKTAKDIDLAQSVILASLPQAPSRYNPYGNNKFSHLLKEFSQDELHARNIKKESDLAKDEYVRGLIGQWVDLGGGQKIYIKGRTDLVLSSMVDQGKITDSEQKQALDELQKIVFNEYKEMIKAPHFVFYIKQILEDKYGKDVVEQGGLKVYTTLDGKLQEYAEEVVAQQGEINEKQYGVNNAAVLTIDSKTGQILAMVGSRDYYNDDIDGKVNVVMRPRQPGSSFKPFVYAQAFLNGYGPGTVLYDVPMKIGGDRPENFNGQFMGQLSARKALGQSRNIPAIQAYFLAGEQDPIIDLVKKMGITTLNKTHSYGYPLAIGAGEVPLIEMVNAYATFSNAGKKPEITGILKVENSNGDVLEEWKQKEFEEVLDPQIAYLISSILSDREASVGPALYVNGKTNAAKTGTSTKENKKEAGGAVRPSDGWTLGYTPSITTGVWIGNTDGTGLGFYADGYNAAAPIFRAVMTKALEGKADEPFVEPEGIKHVSICKLSGKLAGPNTPAALVTTEIFAGFAVPTQVDDSFYTVKIDKISGLLANDYTPQDAVEEVLFQKYEPPKDMLNLKNDIADYYKSKTQEEIAAELGILGSDVNIRVGYPPTEYDNIHTAQTAKNAPSITITNPVSGGLLGKGGFTVDVDIEAKNGISAVEYYLNDKKEYSSNTPPYSGHLMISKFMQPGSEHLVVAKIIDNLGYSAQAAVEVKVEDNSSGSSQESSVTQEESMIP